MSDALTVQNPAVAAFALATRNLGAALDKLTDAEVPAAIAMMRRLEKLVEDNKDTLTDRVKLWLNVHGQQVTEKGTTEASINGWVVRAVPMKTGIDPKKLEQTLRAKGLDPADWMQTTLSYKFDAVKYARLLRENKFSESDVKACQYDKSFRVEVNPRGDYTNE